MTHSLDRRAFLRTAGASAAGHALAAGVWQPITAAGPQTPKFRFVPWNDTHVQRKLTIPIGA